MVKLVDVSQAGSRAGQKQELQVVTLAGKVKSAGWKDLTSREGSGTSLFHSPAGLALWYDMREASAVHRIYQDADRNLDAIRTEVEEIMTPEGQALFHALHERHHGTNSFVIALEKGLRRTCVDLPIPPKADPKKPKPHPGNTAMRLLGIPPGKFRESIYKILHGQIYDSDRIMKRLKGEGSEAGLGKWSPLVSNMELSDQLWHAKGLHKATLYSQIYNHRSL